MFNKYFLFVYSENHTIRKLYLIIYIHLLYIYYTFKMLLKLRIFKNFENYYDF
jgi:hypothetical protein